MKKTTFKIEEILADGDLSGETMELPLAARTFALFRLSAALISAITLIQIAQIGFGRHGEYRAQAKANMQNVRSLEAERGVITDRNGETLASNKKVFQAVLSARQLPVAEQDRREAVKAIGAEFDLRETELVKAIEQKLGYIDDEITLSEALPKEKIVSLTNRPLPGVTIREGFRRFYPDGAVFAHVLGYIGAPSAEDIAGKKIPPRDLIGKTGLEKEYDAELRGRHGSEVSIRDALGRVTDTRVVSLAVRGRTVQTYLDGEFQRYFYSRLEAALQSLNRKSGIGIALNPKNGEVLVLFSIPAFDPEAIEDYLHDPDLPMFNRAVSGFYSPGSTIKPLVALAALTEGVISPTERIFSAGQISIPNPFNPGTPGIFRDWAAHGWVDVRSALARSSNVYFYEVGGGFESQPGLGIERLKEWWGRFRLDKKTGIDLPEEKSGFLPDPEWKVKKTGRNWLLGDTYNVSIGQGDLLLTPIGLLNYMSAIGNGGTLYRPRIMQKITAEGDWLAAESKPEGKRVISERARPFLLEVQKGLADAVAKNYGTAHLLSDIPVPIAAKTGSAQILNNRTTNAFFAGYLPADNPQLAVLIIIENARAGSLNTIPIAHDIFQWYYENRMSNS